jgi:hypothetical protein
MVALGRADWITKLERGMAAAVPVGNSINTPRGASQYSQTMAGRSRQSASRSRTAGGAGLDWLGVSDVQTLSPAARSVG